MRCRNLWTLMFSGLLAIGLAGCDVDVEPGTAPEVDVQGPDVDVEMEKKRVTVPDVDVNTEEREVDVPDVTVDVPDDEEN